MKVLNKKYLLFLILLFGHFLQNCSDPISIDNDRIYRGKLVDYINIVNHSDTVNIVFEQKKVEINQKESIPFRVTINNNDSLIKLNLYGHYQCYSENPKVVKEIENIKDTLFIRYYYYNKFNKLLKTTNSIHTKNHSAPILEYVKIDSIIVEKDLNKVLNIKSRFMN